jgi:hypothetical protein
MTMGQDIALGGGRGMPTCATPMHTVAADISGDVQCGTVTVSQTLRAKVASGHRNPGWVNFTCTRQRHIHTTPASNVEHRDDAAAVQTTPDVQC